MTKLTKGVSLPAEKAIWWTMMNSVKRVQENLPRTQGTQMRKPTQGRRKTPTKKTRTMKRRTQMKIPTEAVKARLHSFSDSSMIGEQKLLQFLFNKTPAKCLYFSIFNYFCENIFLELNRRRCTAKLAQKVQKSFTLFGRFWLSFSTFFKKN